MICIPVLNKILEFFRFFVNLQIDVDNQFLRLLDHLLKNQLFPTGFDPPVTIQPFGTATVELCKGLVAANPLN